MHAWWLWFSLEDCRLISDKPAQNRCSPCCLINVSTECTSDRISSHTILDSRGLTFPTTSSFK